MSYLRCQVCGSSRWEHPYYCEDCNKRVCERCTYYDGDSPFALCLVCLERAREKRRAK